MDKKVKKLRCAIYTRKSHEEGLEQEFNSLDAQREAALAYINSQKHEGWTIVDKHYDDGGISGGTLERDGLKMLLEDVEKGLIDIIVVYKVDRLSRSIHDFAKLMDTFDENDVSFVSVTQQFNTTSSMGRLTLNILLSFAQFEREVTGERIRDKIAASKKKGFWMGGTVPMGFKIEDRRLIPIPEEVEFIEKTFSYYIENQSLLKTAQQLNEQGYKTKYWFSKTGNAQGGKALTPKYIHRILTNPIYIGKIKHKNKVYNGLHKALIDNQTWEKVQRLIKNQKTESRHKTSYQYLLKGKLKTSEGFTMSPSSSIVKTKDKRKKKLPYYVSQKAIKEGYKKCPIGSVNAQAIDRYIELLILEQLDDCKYQYLIEMGVNERNQCIYNLLEMIELSEARIRVFLHLKALKGLENKAVMNGIKGNIESRENAFNSTSIRQTDNYLIIESNIYLKEVVSKAKILGSLNHEDHAVNIDDQPVIKAIARAYLWLEELRKESDISISDLAKKTGFNKRYIEKIIALTRISPDQLLVCLSYERSNLDYSQVASKSFKWQTGRSSNIIL